MATLGRGRRSNMSTTGSVSKRSGTLMKCLYGPICSSAITAVWHRRPRFFVLICNGVLLDHSNLGIVWSRVMRKDIGTNAGEMGISLLAKIGDFALLA